MLLNGGQISVNALLIYQAVKNTIGFHSFVYVSKQIMWNRGSD